MTPDLRQVMMAFRKEFWVVGGFSAVSNLLMLMPTLYMMQVFDRVMLSGSGTTLLVLSLITLFMYVLMAVAEWSRTRVLVRAGVRLDDEMGSRAFRSVFSAYLKRTSDNPSRAFSDLTELRYFITGRGIIAFFDAPWTPIYIAVLWLLHPALGAFALAFMVIQLLVARYGHARQLEPTEASTLAQAEEARFLQSKLRGADVVESMGMLPALRARWLARRREALDLHARAKSIAHAMTASSGFMRYLQQSLSLAVGAWLAVEGEITPGAMIAANVLTSRALAPIDQLVSGWSHFLSAKGAFERLQALFATLEQENPALSRMPPNGAIAVQDLTVIAPGRQVPILRSVSLDFPLGSVTAVLGHSGSGKSTLARVLMGVWPPTQGEVLLDGQPLSGWSREALGEHVGFLPQGVELFDGSIADNIARFREVDPEAVVQAAQLAGLHDMILRLPQGYDTPVAENGGSLSGGQRQRIGLARALYGAPRLVVLDEPNSNLDDVGEAALLNAVRALKSRGVTVVLISHRPQVLAVADRVAVLHQGSVQAAGPRDAVLAAIQQSRQGGTRHD